MVKIILFADSDYAEDASRRSRQGTIVMMNGGPVAWASILGKTICCSTAEAEVMAAVSAAKEAVHLKLLLKELQIDSDHIIIGEDNQACIAQVKGGLTTTRSLDEAKFTYFRDRIMHCPRKSWII